MKILNVNFPNPIKSLAKALSDASGTTYIVGGAVIDLINGHKVKDWDMEVFNLSYNNLSDIASKFGKTDLIGNKFGVVKVKVDDLDVELAVPRVENNVGIGHTSFDIDLVPNLSLYEAARRRDFTMNALYLEVANKRLHDPFGGYYDYRKGILSHIDAKTFVEDPLRVFRAMQIVSRKQRPGARKSLRVTHDCVQLCKSMKEACRQLSGDAIYGEFYKMLMLGNKPDQGLRFLVRSELIDLFPELKALIGCKQNLTHHPEGSVMAHTQLVLKEAVKYRDLVPEDWKVAYMFGMLLHDIGKPVSTDPDTLRSVGHDFEGEKMAKSFMEKLSRDKKLNNRVSSIVRGHMRPIIYMKDGSKASAWRKLHNICPLNVLAYVAIADSDGRGFDKSDKLGVDSDFFKGIMHMHEVLGEHTSDIPSKLKGRHLIAAGFKPGKGFGVMINKAYEHQLETGCEDIDELVKVATE